MERFRERNIQTEDEHFLGALRHRLSLASHFLSSQNTCETLLLKPKQIGLEQSGCGQGHVSGKECLSEKRSGS